MFRTYYQLTKPGIIYGNVFTAVAGFLFGSRGQISVRGGFGFGGNFVSFFGMLVGMSLVIASSCVLNNIWDADIDKKMDRTKNRAMAVGVISKQSAVIFSALLMILGILSLWLFTNLLTLASAIIGVVFYVLFYTPLKRTTVYSTLVGAVSGAVPITAGYLAATNSFDAGAAILFFILFLWQMPHFYAIGIYRLKDYTQANIPIFPVKEGVEITKIHIFLYIIAFIFTALLLKYFNYTSFAYLISIIILGLYWLLQSAKGFKKGIDNIRWGRKVFLSSLIVLTLFCVIISIDSFLLSIK